MYSGSRSGDRVGGGVRMDPPVEEHHGQGPSVLRSMAEGFAYVWRTG